MRIIGADLSPDFPSRGDAANTLVLLNDEGRVQSVRRPASLPAVAVDVGELAGGEPFLLGVNLPVVVPAKPTRSRPIEGIARRKLGYRLPPGGRAALAAGNAGIAGEALLAALAAGGLPCLTHPDRDRRRSGVAEIHPGLVSKILLWEGSAAARAGGPADKADRFREYAPPDYHPPTRRIRGSLAERAVTLDLVLRALASVAGYDIRPAVDALGTAETEVDLDGVASLLDACLVAGTAGRYLHAPESCVFLEDRDGGYLILPADSFVRRLSLGEAPSARARLFPKTTLRERLDPVADLRTVDLLELPGRPQRIEATFRVAPIYEFDNLDEMLWWKHCRHVGGPTVPIDGLRDLVVSLGKDAPEGERSPAVRLVRSRHRTLSFRFDSPAAWRGRVPTRDGRTYAFRVLRATFDALATEG